MVSYSQILDEYVIAESLITDPISTDMSPFQLES